MISAEKKILFSFVFSLFCGQLNAYEGLYYLNSFLETSHFFGTSASYQSAEIEAPNVDINPFETIENELTLNLEYGKRLNEKWFIQFELPISYAHDSSFDYGQTTKRSFHTRGLREPGVKIHHRLNRYTHKDSGERFVDISIHYIPSLFRKHTGTNEGNRFHGRHSILTRLSRGARYERFEAKISAKIDFHSVGTERNLVSQSDYEFAAYYRAGVDIELQYNEIEKWPIFIGSGMDLTSNYDVKGPESKSRIQKGTATFAHLGAHYLQEQDRFWTIRASVRSNDVFTTNTLEGNYQGDLYQMAVLLGFTRQY